MERNLQDLNKKIFFYSKKNIALINDILNKFPKKIFDIYFKPEYNFALVVGAEQYGISNEWFENESISLSIRSTNDVDSLNASTAASNGESTNMALVADGTLYPNTIYDLSCVVWNDYDMSNNNNELTQNTQVIKLTYLIQI